MATLLTGSKLLSILIGSSIPKPHSHTWKMAIRLTGAEFLSSSDSASIDLRSGCMMTLKDLRDPYARSWGLCDQDQHGRARVAQEQGHCRCWLLHAQAVALTPPHFVKLAKCYLTAVVAVICPHSLPHIPHNSQMQGSHLC